MKKFKYLIFTILLAMVIHACTIDKHNIIEPEDKEVRWWEIPYFYGNVNNTNIHLQSGRDTIIHNTTFSDNIDTGYIHRTYRFSMKNGSRFFHPDSLIINIGPVKYPQTSGYNEEVFLDFFNMSSFNYTRVGTAQTGVSIAVQTDSTILSSAFIEQTENSYFTVLSVKEIYTEEDEEGNKDLIAIYLRGAFECSIIAPFGDVPVSVTNGEMVGIYIPF